MTHDDELIERVASAMMNQSDWAAYMQLCPNSAYAMELYARNAIAAVRAYDAERRASVLDVAALVERSDPDDYRDLPVSMTGPVRLKGGLTEGPDKDGAVRLNDGYRYKIGSNGKAMKLPD